MPTSLRALYADLDGSLLGPDGSALDAKGATAAALRSLREAGATLVLVSGRTRRQLREAARILGADAYAAELGGYLVERRSGEEIPSFGAFRGRGLPFQAIARSGAGSFLMDRFPARLEPHDPWAFEGREVTMLFRGAVDTDAANDALVAAGYRWLELVDNGSIRRRSETLDVDAARAYHLAPKGVSKAAAVRRHMERNGIERGEAAAVGDSPADAAMGAHVARFLDPAEVGGFGAAVEKMLLEGGGP